MRTIHPEACGALTSEYPLVRCGLFFLVNNFRAKVYVSLITLFIKRNSLIVFEHASVIIDLPSVNYLKSVVSKKVQKLDPKVSVLDI